MKNTLIALAMTASLVFVGSPAQADDIPTPVGDPVVTNTTETDPSDPCYQAYEDAFWTYSELQWQIELKQRAQLKVQDQKITIRLLREKIRRLNHRLNK